MQSLFKTLSSRVLVTVFLIVAPLLTLRIYNLVQEERRALASAEQESLNASQLASVVYEQFFKELETTLQSFAAIPEMRAGGETCSRLLHAIRVRTSPVMNLWVLNAAGSPLCGSDRFSREPLHRKSVPQALKSGKLEIGEYHLAPGSAHELIDVSVPILHGTDRAASAVILAELDLERLHRQVSDLVLPRSHIAALLNDNGTILAISPEAEPGFEPSFPDRGLFLTTLSSDLRSARGIGFGDKPFIFGVTRLHSSHFPLYAAVGIPESEALAGVQKVFLKSLVLWISFSLIILLGAWIYGRKNITGPIRNLLRLTSDLAQGKLDSSTPSSDAKGEVGELEDAFRQMTSDLARRDRQINESHQELLKQRQVALESSKMAVLGEMAGGIAFEIKNPLSVLSVRAVQIEYLLAMPNPDSQFLTECVGDMKKSVTSIVSIVNSMRTFSRDGSRDPLHPCPLNEVVQGTLDLCRERMKISGIRLEVQIATPEPVALCRATQIQQALLNLINNSCDAVSGGEDKWIRISVQQTGEWAEICVMDSGRGIAPDLLPRLFEPFSGNEKRLGIGLSNARSLCENNRGTLFFETSSANTCFVIRLPQIKRKGGVE